VALVALAARRRLLAVHGRLLRHDDLEDCYSQATLELIAQARAGQLRFVNRAHLRNTLTLRFASRVADRRRALRGRSPAQALLDGALSLGAAGGREVEIADPRADVERLAQLREQLRSLERAVVTLSPDQRLLLACQIGLGMGAGEFCRRFGWTHEKHRKVAQRARRRLRALLDGEAALHAATAIGCAPAAHAPLRVSADGSAGTAQPVSAVPASCVPLPSPGLPEKTFDGGCPVLASRSEERTGTLL
jgi:DNA-directed RNA polymerase specialized sigma24 family protein